MCLCMHANNVANHFTTATCCTLIQRHYIMFQLLHDRERHAKWMHSFAANLPKNIHAMPSNGGKWTCDIRCGAFGHLFYEEIWFSLIWQRGNAVRISVNGFGCGFQIIFDWHHADNKELCPIFEIKNFKTTFLYDPRYTHLLSATSAIRTVPCSDFIVTIDAVSLSHCLIFSQIIDVHRTFTFYGSQDYRHLYGMNVICTHFLLLFARFAVFWHAFHLCVFSFFCADALS